MNTAFFVLAILGCGDDNQGCQQLRVDRTAYATQEACSQAVPNVLMRNSDIDFPVVSGECRARTQAEAAADMAKFPLAA